MKRGSIMITESDGATPILSGGDTGVIGAGSGGEGQRDIRRSQDDRRSGILHRDSLQGGADIAAAILRAPSPFNGVVAGAVAR